jgi:hypothetical protein
MSATFGHWSISPLSAEVSRSLLLSLILICVGISLPTPPG